MLKASELETCIGFACVANVTVLRLVRFGLAVKFFTAAGRGARLSFQRWLRVLPATVFGFSIVGTSSTVGRFRGASFTAAANQSLNRTPKCCAFGFPRLRLGAG